MGPRPASMDDYLAGVPEAARITLERVRQSIRKAAPKEAVECITYGMPGFHYKGGLVAFAAFKAHCSLFPMSGRVIEALGDELAGYRTSKGTIQFPIGKPLPAALIRRIVQMRVAENEAREGARRTRKR